MTIYEINQQVFGPHQNEAIINNYETIKKYFSTKTDIAVIDVREVAGEDVTNKREDPTYLMEENLMFTENGIKIVIATPETAELLKAAIPRTVKSLTIPSTMLSDLSFLKEFPNLEELTLSDNSMLDREDLKYIRENTNIKNIKFRSPATINQMKGQPGCHVIEAGKKIASVNGLILRCDNYYEHWTKNLCFNTESYENLSELKKIYEIISPELEGVETVKLTKSSEDIVCGLGNIITRNPDEMKFSFSNLSPKELSTIYNGMKKDKIKEVQYDCETKIYEYLPYLKELAHNTDFTINYPGGTKATYEEFLNMRATMDYYKEILTTSNLSPAEQVAAVYDILKTMRYKENKQDKTRARNIHGIVTDGTIVCIGYSKFAKYLLEEIGIKSTTVSLDLLEHSESHARNFVRIDDDKYNIHGVFAMDITWDSDKDVSVIEEDAKKKVIARPSEEQKDKIIDKYDSLVLYRYFLIPMDQYELRFPNERNPLIYEEYKKDKGKRLTHESRAIAQNPSLKAKNAYVLSLHEELFTVDEGPLTVDKYLSAPKPSLETFKEIIANARRAEGYNAQEAERDVERVLELQNMLKEQNPDGPDTFFKPATK